MFSIDQQEFYTHCFCILNGILAKYKKIERSKERTVPRNGGLKVSCEPNLRTQGDFNYNIKNPLDIPKARTANNGIRSWSLQGPKTLNSLSESIKTAQNTRQF